MTQMLEFNSAPSPYLYSSESPAARPAYYRVVIFSSQPLLLLGLREALNKSREFSVVGEARTPEAALEIVFNRPVSLLIVDQSRPDAALAWLRTLQARLGGHVPVVALGSNETSAQIRHLREAGANFYASKEQEWSDLHRLLTQAVAGRQPLPGVKNLLPVAPAWTAVTAKPQPPVEPKPAESPLSRREIEILEVIAQGLNNKEVASQLCISGHTLKNHLNNIFKKLAVEDRTQALMLGLRYGWVQL